MEISAWLVGLMSTKAAWNSVMEKCGAQFAMTSGELLMLKWCAANSGTTLLVPLLSTLPSLDKEQARSGLMMWSVLDPKQGSSPAGTHLLEAITASIWKMPELGVHHQLVMKIASEL